MDQLVAQEMKAQDAKWISIMRFRGQGDDVRSFAVKRKSCSEYKSICLLFEYNSWWRVSGVNQGVMLCMIRGPACLKVQSRPCPDAAMHAPSHAMLARMLAIAI